jgi:hypothetical protein
MQETFNIYCDESCHLENDHQKVMVLGAIWTSAESVPRLAKLSRALKAEYGLAPDFELKWGKVSVGRQDYYEAVLRWFWETPELHFRGLIVPDKSKLDHENHNQTHDDWYYKMYFDLIKVIIDPNQTYNVYLDIKDSRGRKKVQKLHEVLSNAHYDFARSIIQKIQLVRSEEVELVQLADFIIGIVSYANRGLEANHAKHTLVQQLRSFSRYSLKNSTLLRESKLNLFRWRAREES